MPRKLQRLPLLFLLQVQLSYEARRKLPSPLGAGPAAASHIRDPGSFLAGTEAVGTSTGSQPEHQPRHSIFVQHDVAWES